MQTDQPFVCNAIVFSQTCSAGNTHTSTPKIDSHFMVLVMIAPAHCNDHNIGTVGWSVTSYLALDSNISITIDSIKRVIEETNRD